MEAGCSSAPDSTVAAPVRTRLTAAEAKELKDQFLINYPGELLTPSTTPSLAFLAFVKEAVETRTLNWVPWKRRSSEHDEIEATENRRPRNDKQLIRSILADGDVGLDELPEARVDTSKPVEVALVKSQCLLVSGNALAINGACHLLVMKRFHSKFLDLAVARPRDPHLRPPTIHEVIDAEQAAWQNVADLMSEGKWSLNDSLSEVAYCRQVFHTALAPRPKAPQRPPDDHRRKRLPSPKPTLKAKAKTQPKPVSPDATEGGAKYQESWPRKTVDGKASASGSTLESVASGRHADTPTYAPSPMPKVTLAVAVTRHFVTKALRTDLCRVLTRHSRRTMQQ